MSRILGVDLKVNKDANSRSNIQNTIAEDTDEEQIQDLLRKLPKLAELFVIHRKIGVGTFSSVYLASLRQHEGLPDKDKKWFAVKHLVPNTHPARVEHELRCLQELGGKDNIISVELCLRQGDTIVFVMPYIPHKKFSEYVHSLTPARLRRYMRALLRALATVHAAGVIHRDVKPSNFLWDQERDRYMLVDFGLAQRITHTEPPPVSRPDSAVVDGGKRPREEESEQLPPTKRPALDLTTSANKKKDDATSTSSVYVDVDGCLCGGRGRVCARCLSLVGARAPRAGTGGFRPPEVLLRSAAQAGGVDVWAAGVVLAAALTGRYPLCRAVCDPAALAELCALLGAESIQRAALRLRRRVVVSRQSPGVSLRRLADRLADRLAGPTTYVAARGPRCGHCRLAVTACVCLRPGERPELFTRGRTVAGYPDAAFSLCARLLDPDPTTRISAEDALKHPFITGDC